MPGPRGVPKVVAAWERCSAVAFVRQRLMVGWHIPVNRIRSRVSRKRPEAGVQRERVTDSAASLVACQLIASNMHTGAAAVGSKHLCVRLIT